MAESTSMRAGDAEPSRQRLGTTKDSQQQTKSAAAAPPKRSLSTASSKVSSAWAPSDDASAMSFQQQTTTTAMRRPTQRRTGNLSAAYYYSGLGSVKSAGDDSDVAASASGMRTTHHHEREERNEQEQEEPALSLQDWLAGLAVSGTLDFLKLAGGLTLNTAGTIAAPPIYLARTHLLPVLWQATIDTIRSKTPSRLSDWFRILTSSVRQFFSVLAHTQQGQHFRGRLLVLWGDICDILSADITRQVILDGTACWVKLAEWLDTPQCHAYTEQVAVWACRLVQAASQGKNQLLIHNLAEAFQSGAKLLADPHTTLALAEVTAYLCHALEMQENHQQLFAAQNVNTNTDAQNKTTTQTKATRRKERNAYQTTTHANRLTTVDRPQATVEQVILSSLGGTCAAGGGDGDDGTASVPSRVTCQDDDDDDDDDASGSVVIHDTENPDWDQASSIREQVQQQQNDDDETSKQQQPSSSSKAAWHEKARSDIDVEYLKEQIHARANAMAAKADLQRQQSFDDDGEQQQQQDLEELAKIQEEFNGTKKDPARTSLRQRIRLQAMEMTGQTPAPPDPFQVPEGVHALPLEGETAVDHFRRILNEILEQKREDALQNVDASSKNRPKGRVNRHPAAASGGGDAFSSLKERIEEQLRSNGQSSTRQTAVYKPSAQAKRIGLLLLVVAGLLGCTWFSLGCYGLYTLVRAQRGGHSYTSFGPKTVPVDSANEIVVRVIRQVVHVDASGNQIDASSDTVASSETMKPGQMDQIANCVAEAMN